MNNTLILAQKLEDHKKMLLDSGLSEEMADKALTLIFEETGLQYCDLLNIESNDVNRAIKLVDKRFASFPDSKLKR